MLIFVDDEDTDDEDKEIEKDEEVGSEDEDDDENSEKEVNEEMDEDEGEDGDSNDKEYDENEEEIVKPKFKPIMSTKTGMIRKEFVDGEAELSGSEIGSADEDERGMDDYEDDGADAEVFDEESMKDQVGRMHLKQLLDDDQREIRLLQDAYLEDGDLHSDGKGRERQYKWKNAGM